MTLQETQKQELSTNGNGAERTHSKRLFIPRVDIYENEKEVVIFADMPGIDEKSVDITLEKNILSIYGEIPEDYPDNYSLSYSEYDIGDYQRKFTLSNQIDQDKIEATVKDGVLTLNLPKADTAKLKKIAVKAV